MTPYKDVDRSLPDVVEAARPWRFLDNAAPYQYDWDGTRWIRADTPDSEARLPAGTYCLPTGAYPWVPCREYQSEAVQDFIGGNTGPFYPPGGGQFALEKGEDTEHGKRFTLVRKNETTMDIISIAA